MNIRKAGFVLILIIILAFSGCSKAEKQSSDGIITIDDETIGVAKVMIYLLQVKEEFEQVGGQDIWYTEDFTGGKSAEQVAKEGALENIIRNTILESKAKSLNIELSGEVSKETQELAKSYFQKIPKNVIEENHITEEIVIDTFLEFKLASEVNNSIHQNYEPTQEQIREKMYENDDYVKLLGLDTKEIMTMAEVKHILTKTAQTDTNGNTIPLSEEEQEKAFGDITKAYNLAKQGYDFDSLIAEYSQEDNEDSPSGQYSISIALLEGELQDVLKDLKIGEISNIAQTQYGYHLFKLMDITKPTQEEIEKYNDEFIAWEKTLEEEAIKSLKNQAFDGIYNDWRNETTININELLYGEMSLFE